MINGFREQWPGLLYKWSALSDGIYTLMEQKEIAIESKASASIHSGARFSVVICFSCFAEGGLNKCVCIVWVKYVWGLSKVNESRRTI